MARQRSDREDLMAEAVALLPRMQLQIAGQAGEIIVGRRADGRWSIYFDGDPVYQFDASGRLRRAFVDDVLFRSQGTTLARLIRQESPTETTLLRHDLTPEQFAEFEGSLKSRLQGVQQAHAQGQLTVTDCVPAESHPLPEFLDAIAVVIARPLQLAVALTRR